MHNFTNAVILPENLPTLDSEQFNRLDKKYLSIIVIRLVLVFLIAFGGCIAFLILSEATPGIPVKIAVSAFIVLWLAFSIGITLLGFPRKGYLVRENDISFKKGILFYKETSVPFNRIQHVEVTQGVLAKAYKISTLKLFTAGGNSSDLSIPGLPKNQAQQLKDFLSEKISKHE
ncbi:PH domain-containing protein [uncultured Draconibacterium sp.]|uniref:PH domain-containing protein n=1 Tax=uncultured Draconibacterium sp. TaxID=1573823 RepID=UPI0025D97F4D|nr:PH domain-containing protein [uncultured Draconibacterium sp.]